MNGIAFKRVVKRTGNGTERACGNDGAVYENSKSAMLWKNEEIPTRGFIENRICFRN